jgi:hypothetical protein
MRGSSLAVACELSNHFPPESNVWKLLLVQTKQKKYTIYFMRKIYLLIVTGLLSLGASAQSQKEIHVGIGTGSIQEVAVRNGTHPLFKMATASGEPIKRTFSPAGPIRIGISSHENSKFLLGAEFNYINTEVMNDYGTGANEFINFANYTLMASTQYKYFDKPKYTMYTGVQFGVSFSAVKNQNNGKKDQDLTGAFQVNFLGVRYGTKLGVFGEIGYGFNGFLSGGLFYRLD